MKSALICAFTAVAALSAPAFAQSSSGSCSFGSDGKAYFGVRAGVAIPPDAIGVAPTFGAELGLAPETGLGLGLHFIYSPNPPSVDWIGDAAYGFGVEADIRWYLPRTGPMQFYPFFSAGFLTGPDEITRENVMLPLINPGLGAKLDIGPLYAGFEFGLAALHIPFVNFSVGARAE